MKKINTLLIGSGGREHAMLWKMAQSKMAGRFYVNPGSDCMSLIPNVEKAEIDIDNHQSVIDFCRKKLVELCVIGPELPLVQGLTDKLENADIKVFGPSKKASQLEASKLFTKNLCKRNNIKTAEFESFNSIEQANDFIKKNKFPLVIKADGLAAGKGVIIANNLIEAQKAIDKFFGIGQTIIIEQFLQGIEISFFVICDGKTIMPFHSAQDYKRAYEKDSGPNTGGMGAISPSPKFNPELEEKVMLNIIEPTIKALEKQAIKYKGVLYAGLMIVENQPYLLEYNVRFGDPECQNLMSLYKGDFLELCYYSAIGRLAEISPKWSDEHCANIVIVNQDYPNKIEQTGNIIKGLEKATTLPDVNIFHAGTRYKNGSWLASGGRVLNCTARAANLDEALKKAYEAVAKIEWQNARYRKDIGWQYRKNISADKGALTALPEPGIKRKKRLA